MCRGHAQYPAFAPDTLFLLQALQKWQLGFFGLFVSFGSRICPNCACTQLFLVPYSFFVILLLKERCVQVQTLQQCSKGSQVPACLTPSGCLLSAHHIPGTRLGSRDKSVNKTDKNIGLSILVENKRPLTITVISKLYNGLDGDKRYEKKKKIRIRSEKIDQK